MALILNIDVSGKKGLVVLAEDGRPVGEAVNNDPMDHASFLQPSIRDLMERNKKDMHELDAICVSNGPGSYTGLRVGLASAKGLCFALNIPLITLNSLQIMAKAASDKLSEKGSSQKMTLKNNLIDSESVIIAPMIDARRMEVFYGIYDMGNQPVILSEIAILDERFLQEQLEQYMIVFTGSGAEKWMKICKHPNAVLMPELDIQDSFCQSAFLKFQEGTFAPLASAEPFYCKAFYDTQKNKA